MIVITISLSALVAASSGSAGLSRATANSEAAELRQLRMQNNNAMAARDLGQTMQIAADDYVLIGGNDGIHRSKSDMQESWSHAFADPKARPCVRRPARFEVGEYDGIRRAAELGSWQCPVETAKGLENLFGRFWPIGRNGVAAGR